MMEKNKKLDIFDILLFIGILFIGSDIWGINIGFNIRFIQIYYVVVVIYLLFTRRYLFYLNKFLIFFLTTSAISTIFSINILHSLLYYIWILYDFVILLPIFYCYVKEKGPEQIFILFKYVFRIIFVFIIVQFILDGFLKIELPFLVSQHHKGITRPALWFYEPSYLATFLMIYFPMVCYKLLVKREIKMILDFIIMGIATLLVTSTTGFIGVAISVLITFVIFLISLKSFKHKIIACLSFLVICFFGVLMTYILLPSVFEVFIMRIFNDGLAASSGNRISEYKYQIDAFFSRPLSGVGLDCYGAYRGNVDLVPTNVSLELLACGGIIGFVSFYSIVLYPVFKVLFGRYKQKYNYSKMFVIALIVLIIVLQANQNYMRLYLWMMIIVVYTTMKYEEEKTIEENIEV